MSYIVPKEKPKCYNCPFRTLDYCGLLTEYDCVTVYVNEMSVSEYCPLIEILTPHSDLVDRDALIAEYDSQHKGPVGGARQIMVDAKAVIEAEGSEE